MSILADRHVPTHRELPEKAHRTASASLRLSENESDRREKIGSAFREASERWSLKELSEMLKRDERQIARWKSGAETLPLHVVMGSELLWPRLVVALARVRPGAVEVETVMRVRIA